MRRWILAGLMAASLASIAIAEDIKEFRGIPWGADIKSVSGMVETPSERPDIKIYTRDDDEMQIGGANLHSITYRFWKGQFFAVSLNAEGYANIAALKEVAFKKFGRMMQPNQFMEDYIKTMKTTQISFITLPLDDLASLSISHRPILKSIEQEEKQRAAQGAAAGF